MSIHRKYHGPLIALATSNNKDQRVLLKSLNPQIIRILAQIAANVVNGNIPLSSKQHKHLRRFKLTLRKLRDLKSEKSRRKILISQKGGFLPLLIPLAASAVGGLLARVFN